MINQTIISKSLGLNKTAFTNTMTILSTMQQHGESLLKTTLEQSPWLPGSSKDACLYWADFYSKYFNNLKSMADQSFAEIERISLPLLKLAENASPQTIATEKIPTSLPAKKSPDVREKKVSAKETLVAKTLPEKKPVAQNPPPEKPVPQTASAEKPTPQNASAEKPAPQNANIEKPVIQDKPDVNKLNK
jgi:outer membrane biosynthesis protein TonB